MLLYHLYFWCSMKLKTTRPITFVTRQRMSPKILDDFGNIRCCMVAFLIFASFETDWELNVKRRPVLCLNTRRIKYVYIAGTKGACHAAYDWYWRAVQAARWATLRRFSMRVEGSAFLQQPAEVPETALPKGSGSKTRNVLGIYLSDTALVLPNSMLLNV